VGNVKERIGVGSRLAEVAEGLIGRAQVQEEGQVVVSKGMRRSLELEARAGAQEGMPSAC
jgi:hypothetical protein